jgi:hypothetical protein
MRHINANNHQCNQCTMPKGQHSDDPRIIEDVNEKFYVEDVVVLVFARLATGCSSWRNWRGLR